MPDRRRRMRGITAAAALAITLFASGCTTVPPRAGFDDVQRTIAARSQMRLHWIRGTEEDREAAAAVEELLARELTPDTAVQIALLNNPDLQATYEDLMIAQVDLVAAGLLRNPIFSAEIKVIEAGGGTNIELGLVQSFLDILSIPLRQRIAGAAFDAAKDRVAGAVLDLARRTRVAYVKLQSAEQLVEMRGQVLLATAASYDLAQRLRDAGNIIELDLATERAMHEQSKFELAAAEAGALQRREDLNELMGTWGEQTQWRISPRLPQLPAHDPTAEDAERLAVGRNLEVAAARRQIAVAAARLGIAGPEATLADAQVGIAAEREGDGTWSLGPAFAAPLPLWTQGRPAIASAQAELRRAQQLHAAASVRVRAQTRAAHTRMAAARQRAEYYRHVVLPLHQRIVEESMVQYNAMQIGTFQLLMAKQEQIRAGAAYIDALSQYWVASADLEWLVGGDLPIPPSPETPLDPVEPADAPAPEPGEQNDHSHGIHAPQRHHMHQDHQ